MLLDSLKGNRKVLSFKVKQVNLTTAIVIVLLTVLGWRHLLTFNILHQLCNCKNETLFVNYDCSKLLIGSNLSKEYYPKATAESKRYRRPTKSKTSEKIEHLNSNYDAFRKDSEPNKKGLIHQETWMNFPTLCPQDSPFLSKLPFFLKLTL